MDQFIGHGEQKEDLRTLEAAIDEFLSYSSEVMQNELLPYVKKVLQKYRISFQQKYHLPKEVCIFDKTIYWVFVQLELISKETKNCDDLKGILNYCKLIIKELNLQDSKKVDFSLEEEVNLLKNADQKYRIFELAKKNHKKIILFHLPFACEEELPFTIKDVKREVYLEGLIMTDQRKNGTLLNFVQIVGFIYNGLIMDDPFEIPFGFHNIVKIYKDCGQQMTKDEGLRNFIEFFGYALLFDTKYSVLLDKQQHDLGSFLVEFFQNIVNYCYPKEPGEWIELSDDTLCPCGSRKVYKECCKKKKLKWGIQDDKIVKHLPLAKPVIKGIKEIEKMSVELLNRKPKPNDKIFSFITNTDYHINSIIKMLRKFNLDEEKLYASYKTGLVLSELNVQSLPDFEVEDWGKAVDEYRHIVKKENNILKRVRYIDDYLQNLWITYLNQANSMLALILNELREDYMEVQKFKIENVCDFAAFCAERVRKNNKALYTSLEQDHYEVSMAINRMLYEDLLNTNVYFQNEFLFEKQIMTLSRLEQGIYKKFEKDGKVSTKLAVNPQTGETINYSITLKDLSDNATTSYKELYEKLFRELSNFTHLNVTTTNHYFEKADPFYDIDPINISGILGLFLVNQVIFEFSCLNVSDFVHRDIIYFTDKIKKLLMEAFLEIKEVYPSQAPLFDILIECVSDFNYIK